MIAMMRTYDVTEEQNDENPVSAPLKEFEDFRGVLLLGRVRGRLRKDSKVHVVRTHQGQGETTSGGTDVSMFIDGDHGIV